MNGDNSLKLSYKYLIFDIDGTLLDTKQANAQSFVKMMSEMTGRQVLLSEYECYWGIPGHKAFNDFGIYEEELIELGMKKWDQYFSDIQTISQPFWGIDILLNVLSQNGLLLSVVTSKTCKEAEEDLNKAFLRDYFSYIITAEDTIRHKPFPDPLVKMIELMHADKRKCIYIGDTIFDYKCAMATGIDFALAKWGNPSDVTVESATMTLHTPFDLLGLISRNP